MQDVLSSAPTRARRVDTSARARSARPADRRVLGPFSTPAETVARWRRVARRVKVTGARGRPPAKGSVGLRAGSKYAHVSLKPVPGVGIPRDRREDARTAFRSILVSALIVLLLLLFLKMPLHVLLDEAFRAPGELVTLVSTAVTAARTDPAATPSAAAGQTAAPTPAPPRRTDTAVARPTAAGSDRPTDADSDADSDTGSDADPSADARAPRTPDADTDPDSAADARPDAGAADRARHESRLRKRCVRVVAVAAGEHRHRPGERAHPDQLPEARRDRRVAERRAGDPSRRRADIRRQRVGTVNDEERRVLDPDQCRRERRRPWAHRLHLSGHRELGAEERNVRPARRDRRGLAGRAEFGERDVLVRRSQPDPPVAPAAGSARGSVIISAPCVSALPSVTTTACARSARGACGRTLSSSRSCRSAPR